MLYREALEKQMTLMQQRHNVEEVTVLSLSVENSAVFFSPICGPSWLPSWK